MFYEEENGVYTIHLVSNTEWKYIFFSTTNIYREPLILTPTFSAKYASISPAACVPFIQQVSVSPEWTHAFEIRQ